jgi:hypothetical protein
MTHYPRNPTSGRECPPPIDPAAQPYPPGDGCDCDPLPETTAPTLCEPAKCETDPCCNCPTTAATPECIEKLIEQQTTEIAAAEQATKLKEDLTALLEATKKGSEAYTCDAYESLIELWEKLDCRIAELLRTLECKADCWKCVIECNVCPLLHQLHYAEKWLYDDCSCYGHVYDLYDLQYWRTKDLGVKERRYSRINEVLTAWANPAETIAKVINENQTLHDNALDIVGKEPGKVIYDVFFKLVPMHLAIAPPRGSEWETRIDKHFTKFCECGHGIHDHCCGPDVGELRVRNRLIGPQPYLIDPADYLKVVCCLVEKRWTPARVARDQAKLHTLAIESRIARYLGKITGDWKANFEAAARAAIPSVIECCDYEPDRENASRASRQ